MDIENTDAVNDSTRASANLPIKRMPATRTIPYPPVSDDEVYLRINVPDGLETNGKWPTTYGIVQNGHPDPSESVIMHNDNSDDGGVSAKLAAAKGVLASANNSNVSRRAAPVVKRATVPATQPPTSGPSLADELAAKAKNVNDYANQQ
jgi:hypothetical protein